MPFIPQGGSVVYDGDCGICTYCVRILKFFDWAHRLTFFGSHDPATHKRFPELTIDRMREEILVHDPLAGWYGGFQACEWIACRIPLLWIFIPMTFLPGAQQIGDRAYKAVARNRHKISAILGLKACKIS
jgi:predicted DCC family thiol-disulfide oxidoreductase YuxK